jgi:hypothetical protein
LGEQPVEPAGAPTATRWRDIRDAVDTVAKLAAVSVAVLAVWQFQHAKHREFQQLTIESVARLKGGEVSEALVRLEERYAANQINYEGSSLDIARVMNWYEYVAMLYVSDMAIDRCVLAAAVRPYAALIQKVLDETNYPPERRTNFDLLLNRMADDACEPSPISRPR